MNAPSEASRNVPAVVPVAVPTESGASTEVCSGSRNQLRREVLPVSSPEDSKLAPAVSNRA